MKSYNVYYVIKMNSRGYTYMLTVQAKNAREAIGVCRAEVWQKTGRNCFTPGTVDPRIKYPYVQVIKGLPPHK